MSETGDILPEGTAPRSRRVWLLIPLVVFLALVALFYFRLGSGDPSKIPSALINKPVPEFSLPPVDKSTGPGLTSADLSKGVHVLNIWGSWCGPCRLEHDLLMRLAQDKRFDLVGIDYKDIPENAARYLGALGNPFTKIGADHDGATFINFGSYGVPETFIVKDGIVLHKFIGPLSEEGLASDFMPALEKALGNPT